MKLLLIACNEVLDTEVIELLTAAGVTGYTRWTQVQGVGGASGSHLGTTIWPKLNHVIAAVVADPVAADLFDRLRQHREQTRQHGLKAFILPVEAAT